MGYTLVDDVTRAFLGSAPSGVSLAGYTTGTNGIAWGLADWVSHPTAIRIDQDANASDATADVLDYEAGAAQITRVAPWTAQARANYATETRPGQRMPLVYVSLSAATQVTSALRSAGITGGVGLWIADWGLSLAQAEAMIGTLIGGFPVLGVQFRNAGAYDMDVFDSGWWSTRATPHPTFPLKQGMSDGPVAKSGLIHTLQHNLNRWAAAFGVSERLDEDGDYGPLTAGGVGAAQVYFGERGVTSGVCDQAIYTDLAGAVPLTFPAPGSLHMVLTDQGQHVTASWGSVAGSPGQYHFQLEWYKQGFGWVLSVDKTVSAEWDTEALPGSTKFRWRVSVPGGGGQWSPWVTGETK